MKTVDKAMDPPPTLAKHICLFQRGRHPTQASIVGRKALIYYVPFQLATNFTGFFTGSVLLTAYVPIFALLISLSSLGLLKAIITTEPRKVAKPGAA
jgi:hypothetical protein